MKIGSLLDDQLGKNVKYAYYHRGRNEYYFPDRIKEEREQEYYTAEDGNLFLNRPVCWDEAILLRRGIDIRITTEEDCFVDYVWLKQEIGSELKSVEIFTPIDGEYKKIGAYEAESGKMIQAEEIRVPVGFWCGKHLVIRLNADCKPIHILQLEVWSAWDLQNTVWPTPMETDYSREYLPLTALRTVQAKGEEEQFAAEYLVDKLAEKTGYRPDIAAQGDLKICLTEKTEKDAFTISVSATKCEIRAGSRRCLLYAADALLQLIDGERIRCAEIQDEAFMDYRGVHFALPDREQFGFLKDLVKYVFVPLRYNQIYLQISAAMRYDRYPEINAAWLEAERCYEEDGGPKPAHYSFISKDILEKEEVRELCRYFRSYGFEIIPEVQSWAHTQYITMAYPYLAEKAESTEDEENANLNVEDHRPDKRYYHTMCPKHPDYYKVTFGILDEVLDVIEPERFVHMGHDEIYEVGECRICKKLKRGDIFAEEVNTLNAYIKKKGLHMIIWSDMLQQQYYATPTAVNKVDKDIIMMDFVWYFHLDKDLEDRLLSHGFQVMIGNLYTSHYPRFQKRIHKKGMLGGEVSTWVHCDELTYAYEGKMFDFFLVSEALWNRDYREDMRLTCNERIKPLIEEARLAIGHLKATGVEREINLYHAVADPAAVNAGNIPFDIRGLCPYEYALKVSSSSPEAEIYVDSYAEIISFVHATDRNSERVMWNDPLGIGAYIICYEDGSDSAEELLYAANIYQYNAPFGDRIESPLFRHEGYVGTYLCLPICGKTYEGKDYTLGKYSIRNPYPERKIASIKVLHKQNADAALLLFGLTVQ